MIARQNRSCFGSCLVSAGSLLFTLVAIGVIFWFVVPWDELDAEGFSLGYLQRILTQGIRQAYGPVIPVTEGGDGIAPDLVILNRSLSESPLKPTPDPSAGPVNAEPFFLSYKDGTTGEIRWDVSVADIVNDSNSSGVRLLTAEPFIYLAVDDHLQGYNLADGTVAWATRLSDKIHPSCRNCLQMHNDAFIVLSQDNVLQAVNRKTGTPAWSVRLYSGNSSLAQRGFWMVDDQIAFLDEVASSNGTLMAFYLFTAEGQPVHQMQPNCADPDGFFPDMGLNLLSHTFVDVTADQVYFFLDGINGLCAQRWDLTTGQPVWQKNLSDVVGEVSLASYLNRGLDTAVLLDGVLYVNAALPTRGSILFKLDLATGELQPWIEDADYELTPLWQQGQTLVVRAKRTRGSERDELWGIDVTAGTPRWQQVLAATEAMGLDTAAFSEGTWAFQPVAGNFAVVQVIDNPDRILFMLLEPHSGRALVQTTTQTSDGFWTAVAWTNDTAYLTIRDVYAVTLETGEVTRYWP